MHDDRELVEGRLKRFVQESLSRGLYRRVLPVQVERWDVDDEPVPFAHAVAQQYRPARPGEPWGAPWSTTWLRLTGQVPDGWGQDPATALELLVDLGFDDGGPGFQAEALAWRPDGTTIKGVAPRNRHVPLPSLGTALVGNRFEVYLEAAGNPRFEGDVFRPSPEGDRATRSTQPLYVLGDIVLGELDRTVDELHADVLALRGLMEQLATDQPRRHEIVRALDRMLDTVDPDDLPGSAQQARDALRPVLSRPASSSAHRLVATGHAHIDSAWLWPVRETVRKCARTFSSMVDLMDADPTFVFSCSSAQQYAWIQEFYPELFERIRAKVAAGQFVPVGGMWVEADNTMPGGEAMVRQFLEGTWFFRDELGADTPEVWLPDSFGYSGAMPGIAVGAGKKWFLTQKISWNQTNKFPHHTFWWEGIDGSRVFTHFPPADTYNSDLSAADLAHAERNFLDHGRGTVSLVPFGYGDGGGGATREMLASAARFADLEGSPRVRVGRSDEFFAQAQAEYPDAPVWLGELYLELHRGTLTSQANIKAGNRRSEHLLREAELWATAATVLSGADYPAQQLQRLWRSVLLNQFHDILPGSSIAWVYQDAERAYAEVAAELESLITAALAALTGPGELPLVANAAPHARLGVAALGVDEPVAPATGVSVADEPGGGWVLDNGTVRAVVEPDGRVTSLRDHATGREAVAPGAALNVPALHPDVPNFWDAWDIDEFYRHRAVPLAEPESAAAEVAAGAATVTIRRVVGSSPVTQRVVLDAGSSALRLEVDVDWRERRRLLKLGLGLDLRADRSAAETQFGHVLRPTHTNTSWDQARFEFCAHRWLHVGEPDYGVAVANHAVYGHEVTRAVRDDGGTTTTVRLSLLRGATFPDPGADLGPHSFTVSVSPGAGILDAVVDGYRTNLPVRALTGGHAVPPLVGLDNPGIVVEAVKLARDGSGDVLVRLYESLGRRARGRLTANFPTTGVSLTNLIEEPTDDPRQRPGEGAVDLELRPFQVLTVRFARG